MTNLPTKVFATILAFAAVAGLTAESSHAEDKPMQRTITISATGTADAEPDRARIVSGVSTEAESARDALTKNTALMSKVIEEIKSKGVDAKDIQTSSFNVEPIMDYSKDGAPPRIRGYRVSNQVEVLVRDLDKLGNVLDEVVTAGANQINSLNFLVSQEETLKDKARQEAVANAERRARLLATAAHAELGKVLQISEETSYQGPMPFAGARMAKADMAAPIERGTTTLEARVTITWELK